MIGIETQIGRIPVTPLDLQNLFRLNPLALEQLKSLVLERTLVEMKQQKDGVATLPVPADSAPA